MLNKDWIKLVQQRLNEFGFGPLTVDGIWGPKTESAVKEFQKYNNLEPDGIVGSKTLLILCPDLAQREEKTIEYNFSEIKDINYDVDKDGKLDFSQEGIDLILQFEVGGGKEYYEKFLSHPTWPGYESGCTILIGIDLGYNTKESLDKDFSEIDPSIRKRLYPVLGVKGIKARDLLPSIKDIYFPWELAYEIFVNKTIPKWYELTKKTFRKIDDFHPNVKSALTSLVFNRGTLIDDSDRRIEMKRIRDIHVPNKDYAGIAQEIRNMKRIWKGTSIENGMSRRREAEARLVESAIA